MTRYQGPPRLTVAVGDEPFETVKDGMAVVEQVDPGEVVWRDDRGVTCRRWNWRQTPLTRLGAHSTEMWFVVERLEPMPLAAVEEVGAALADAVALAPGAEDPSGGSASPRSGAGGGPRTGAHREDRLEVQHALIHAHPLAFW